MLQRLSIRNVVLIERLDLEWSGGLTVLTGETGAGKSVLLDSLGMALGMRGDAGMVRKSADRASATAEFDVPDNDAFLTLAGEHEIDLSDGQLILKRSISNAGRSRATINDQAVSISLLRQFGEALVEVQGQFDQHGLMDPKCHIDTLDAFMANPQLLDETAQQWREFQRADKAHRDAEARAKNAAAEIAKLEEASTYLNELAPVEGELATLRERRSLLSNLEAIGAQTTKARDGLEAEGKALDSLGQALSELERIRDQAGEVLKPVFDALESAVEAGQEAASQLRRLVIDGEPGELERVEERLFAINDAARRFSIPGENLSNYHAQVLDALQQLTGGDESLKALAKARDDAKQAFQTVAEKLSEARHKSAVALDLRVSEELPSLKLERAEFVTQVKALGENLWSASGLDEVAFTFSANPGSQRGPLHRVASGGELSRLLLALKVALAEHQPIGTMVFDEVDSGVGGATAQAVGERLAKLSQSVQVMVVTHSPQVAATGANHFQVSKHVANDTTTTDIAALDAEQRREEIARMISGASVTSEALAAADQLLNSGNK